MSFVDGVIAGESIYLIPRGSKGKEGVIQIQLRTGSARLEVFHPEDKYQVISDKTLEGTTLEEYIERTESWRKE